MTKRISELQPLPNIEGDELLEVSVPVPNDQSPTGYITRSIRTDMLMGQVSGGVSHRYPIYLNSADSFGDNNEYFSYTIDFDDLHPYSLFVSADGAGHVGNILQMHFSLVGYVVDSLFDTPIAFVCDDHVLWGDVYGGLSRLRTNAFSVPSSPENGSTHYMPVSAEIHTSLPIAQVYPIEISNYFDNTLTITFKIIRPLGGVPWDNSANRQFWVGGYVDIVSLLTTLG